MPPNLLSYTGKEAVTAETCDLARRHHVPQQTKGIEVRVTAGGPSGRPQVGVLVRLRADMRMAHPKGRCTTLQGTDL